MDLIYFIFAYTESPNASDILSREKIRQLYVQSDIFVLPSRGEGYCLPVAEAMAMSLPVIVTNHSGITAYATKDNAYLIPVDETTSNPFGYVEPDLHALILLLQRAYHNPDERKAKGRAGRATIAVITPEIVVSIMTARVRDLVGRRGWFDY
jgi:glycosyltransferase involved in cell wall biosynthesis